MVIDQKSFPVKRMHKYALGVKHPHLMNIEWLITRGCSDMKGYTVKMGLKGDILLVGHDKLIKKEKSNIHRYTPMN